MIESASIHFAEPHAMTTNSPPSLPTYDDVAAAAGRLEGVAHRTPILRSRTADELLGEQVVDHLGKLGGGFLDEADLPGLLGGERSIHMVQQQEIGRASCRERV